VYQVGLSVWSEVQLICIGPADCTATLPSVTPFESNQSINQSIKIYFLTPTRMVLLFCCRFTHVVLKIRPLHECDNDDDGDDSGCRSVSLGSSVTNVMGCVELCCVVLS